MQEYMDRKLTKHLPFRLLAAMPKAPVNIVCKYKDDIQCNRT